MEKFKSIIESKTFIDILIIITVMTVLTILSGFFAFVFLPDKGRELLFPQEILNGLVPYKDITMIYFPLSWYINALVFKLFGVSFNSFVIFQACFCTLLMIIYYLTAKEFINRKISILLSVFVILSCIFCLNDHYLYTFPYSTARVYGIAGGFACLFFLLKLLKTKDIKYGYLAALFTSFAISNKLEFAGILFLFIAGILLYKKLKLTEYIKLFFSLMFFPILSILLLVIQGVTLADIMSSLDFLVKFSSTEVMKNYLADHGAIPAVPIDYIQKGLFPIIITSLLSLLYCFLDKKYNNKIIFPFMLIITTVACHFMRNTECYWVELPIFLIILSLIFFKDIIKDKRILLLLIATFVLSQRAFFKVDLLNQGVYEFPILILYAVIIINTYISKYINKETIEKFITFFLIVLIGTYSLQQYVRIKYIRCPLKTNKGTIYMSQEKVKFYGNTLKYIEDNIPKDAKLLVLPEGMIFNFISDRKADMHCFMMDRPYHEAWGEQQALEILKKADYPYIIIAKGVILSNFGLNYLYDPDASLSANYIFENYSKVYKEVEDNNPQSNIAIYKKNDI